MKIAIVEWAPRICGACDWGVHLSHGGADLGHEVDRLTFSKSGKALSAWGTKKDEWQPFRRANAVEILNGYDLVILTDIACRARVDGVDNRDGSMPYYVDVLKSLKTRWTTMIHDGAYNKRLLPVISESLGTDSFSGVLITTRYPEAAPLVDPLSDRSVRWIVDPYLPYHVDPSFPTVPWGDKTHDLIFLGRLTSNKGQDAAIDLMDDLPASTGLHFWGMNAYGLPSWGWRMWELALERGWKPLRKPILRSDHANLKHPNAPKFYTGPFAVQSFSSQADKLIEYNGDFTSIADVDWSPWIHLNLSNRSLTGTLEYTTLDAIAAGSVAVVPYHQLRYGNWPAVIGVGFTSYSITKGGTWDRPGIISTLTGLLQGGNESFHEIAKAQHHELTANHSPARILDTIIRRVS